MATIYINLLDEGTDVWRPVDADAIGGMDYRIDHRAIVPDDEQWQFRPGDRVKCELRELSGTPVLVAIGLT
jgi:hypothetical protein